MKDVSSVFAEKFLNIFNLINIPLEKFIGIYKMNFIRMGAETF